MCIRDSIFAAPNHIDYEEVESRASNEPELTIVDTESLVGDSLEVAEMEHTSTIKEEARRGSLMEVSFGMKHGKTTWTSMMIWMTGAAQEMNYRGKTPRKTWMIAKIVVALAEIQVGRLYPMKDEPLSKHF